MSRVLQHNCLGMQVMAVLSRALLHASAMDASHMCEHLARNNAQAS